MNNENEREVRNSKNKFELEGNVANINDIYTNQNGKKMLRFDLAQNNNGNSQFLPIVLKGELVNTYGREIKKGDWISAKGRIVTYSKDIEKDGKLYKDKAIDMIAFEIQDRKNHKVYTSNGQIKEYSNNNMNNENETEMER